MAHPSFLAHGVLKLRCPKVELLYFKSGRYNGLSGPTSEEKV